MKTILPSVIRDMNLEQKIKELQEQLEKAEDVLKEISRQTEESGFWTEYTYEAILAQKYFEQKDEQ